MTTIFRDGARRSGIFCAAYSLLEKIIAEKLVDIFQIVQQIQRHRPQFIQNFVSIPDSHIFNNI